MLTSTELRFPSQFQKALEHYAGFGEMYQEEESTAVPGLSYTRLGDSYSRQMVPQGICIAGDYMLITAYDYGRTHNSVIYVLSNRDAQNRRLLTTIELPDQNHVGGIAFDGEFIWIAKSTTGYLSALSYDNIRRAVRSGGDSYVPEAYDEQLYCGMTASFVEYYAGRLWVGTFRSGIGEKGTLACYHLVENQGKKELQRENTMRIPACAQGITFLEKAGKVYMVLTASRGRYWDSTVYLYETVIEENSVNLLRKGYYCFPPMAEELTSDGTNTYFLFESAATSYSTVRYQKCAYPVDRICAISNEKLFAGLLTK